MAVCSIAGWKNLIACTCSASLGQCTVYWASHDGGFEVYVGFQPRCSSHTTTSESSCRRKQPYHCGNGVTWRRPMGDGIRKRGVYQVKTVMVSLIAMSSSNGSKRNNAQPHWQIQRFAAHNHPQHLYLRSDKLIDLLLKLALFIAS